MSMSTPPTSIFSSGRKFRNGTFSRAAAKPGLMRRNAPAAAFVCRPVDSPPSSKTGRGESDKRGLVIRGGAPGSGCPVIASLTGTHLALVVTEPTPSGRHDMERIVGVARDFKIRVASGVNKFILH